VAAAFAVGYAPAGLSAASAAPVTSHHTAATAAATAARPSGPVTARLLSATRPAAKRNAAVPVKYTVKSGDTLSAIAERFYSSPRYWPVLYWANHGQVKYANEISAGQVLTVPVKPAKIPAAPSVLGPAPAPAPVTTAAPARSEAPAAAEYAPSASEGAADNAADNEAAPVTQSAPQQAAGSVSTAGDGSFQSCVIARESGGNSQVMNGSGHYGLYQFSASTWASYGGNPADFGNASTAEQNKVFDNAVAAGGQSNWSAYDGC
jgi:LysM repeat protein